MWLNHEKTNQLSITQYQANLLSSCPNHLVIDGLFNASMLDKLLPILEQPQGWQTQKHTYAGLYVNSAQWQAASDSERFVQRDMWQRDATQVNLAHEFLSFLRSDVFMAVLADIFQVQLTDLNVAKPDINTNYFRLKNTDFVAQHADDSPGREVCMLLYLNKKWSPKDGGQLSFKGQEGAEPVTIAPLFNRCVLFNPASNGAEHWVEKLHAKSATQYRYNVTSWYWRH